MISPSAARFHALYTGIQSHLRPNLRHRTDCCCSLASGTGVMEAALANACGRRGRLVVANGLLWRALPADRDGDGLLGRSARITWGAAPRPASIEAAEDPRLSRAVRTPMSRLDRRWSPTSRRRCADQGSRDPADRRHGQRTCRHSPSAGCLASRHRSVRSLAEGLMWPARIRPGSVSGQGLGAIERDHAGSYFWSFPPRQGLGPTNPKRRHAAGICCSKASRGACA